MIAASNASLAGWLAAGIAQRLRCLQGGWGQLGLIQSLLPTDNSSICTRAMARIACRSMCLRHFLLWALDESLVHCRLARNKLIHRPSTEFWNRRANLELWMFPPLGGVNRNKRGRNMNNFQPLFLRFSLNSYLRPQPTAWPCGMGLRVNEILSW